MQYAKGFKKISTPNPNKFDALLASMNTSKYFFRPHCRIPN